MLENREDEPVNMNLPAYSGKIDNTSARHVFRKSLYFLKGNRMVGVFRFIPFSPDKR